MNMQHAKRKRILADRYANSNIKKGPSLQGISERAAKFVDKCAQSKDGVVDLFVGRSPPAVSRRELINPVDRSVRAPPPPALEW